MKLKDFAENLYLHETLHLFFSLILFFMIFIFYKRWDLAVIAFFINIFIDIDHYFESLFYFRFNLIKIIENRHNSWLQTKKMTILLHSWELVVLIYCLGLRFNFVPLAFSLSFSLMIHLFVDTIIYSGSFKMPVYQYLLIFRALKKFDFLVLYNEGKNRKMTFEEISEKYEKK